MKPDPSQTPIKSPRYDSMTLGPLTDKRILAYIREGRYGPDLKRQQAILDRKVAALDAEQAPPTTKRHINHKKFLQDF